MTKSDFILIIKNILQLKHFYSLNDGRPDYGSTNGDTLFIKWCIGGVGGGSCWDTGEDDPHYSISGDPEPEFEDLDKILEVLCPKISFLQYKVLMREVVKTTSYGDNEYYGNSRDYAVKYFKVDDLYNYLSSKSLLETPDSIIKKIT